MAWTRAIEPHIDGDLVLTSSSAIGREMSSAIAAKKGFPVVQDITSLNDGILVTRSIFSGKAIEEVEVSLPCALSVRANTFQPAEEGGNAEISTVNVSQEVSVAVKDALAKAGERLDVAEADIVISGGRGMGDRQTSLISLR